MTSRNTARVLAAATAAVLFAASCGLGEKERQAGLIAATRDAASADTTARGLLRVEMVPTARALGVDVPERPAVQDGEEPVASVWIDVEVALDFANRRAMSVIPAEIAEPPPARYLPLFDPDAEPAGPPGNGAEGLIEGQAEEDDQPQGEGPEGDDGAADEAEQEEGEEPPAEEVQGMALFKESISFGKRQNLRPSERRVWGRLDYRRLDDNESGVRENLTSTEMLQAAAATVNPHFVLDMVLGVLPGSIKVAGPGTLGDAKVVKYRGRASREKVATELDLSDELTESRNQTFELLGISTGADVTDAEYWVDDDDRVRRVQVWLPQALGRRYQNLLVFTLDLLDYGAPVDIPTPSDDETIEIGGYGRFVRAGLPDPEGS